jgi:hypothetical protein
MKKILEVIAILLVLALGVAQAKSPKHDDFPLTFRVLSVDRVQEANEGSTYWVYQYHIAVGSQGYTVQWFHHLKGGGFQGMAEFYTLHHPTDVSLRKGITYFAKLVDHNHAFKVIVVNDNGKESTEVLDIIGVD